MISSLTDIAQIISKINSALIFCHVRPDGDTLGSAEALYLALKKKGLRCDIVCDGEIPDKFSFASSYNHILKPDEIKGNYDAHISVDVPTEALLGMSWGIYKAGKIRIAIDHHLSNELYAEYTHISDESANTVIIYELIKSLGVEIDKEIAQAILIGIITDTGCFTHLNADAKSLEVASKAIEAGADLHSIVYNSYLKQTKTRAYFFADVISKMRFYLNDRLAVIVIGKDILSSRGLKSDATEGMVDFPLSVGGVEVSVSLLETKNELYRVSFRSNGRVDVGKIAEEFGGGGHIFASGCVVKGPLEEVIEKIVRATDINMYIS